MTFTQFDDPHQFLDRVGSLLAANEAENNLIIGIGSRLTDPGRMEQVGPVLLGCVSDGSQVIGVVIMTPPYNLLLTRADEPVICLIAEGVHQAGLSVPGVLAPKEAAERFVSEWQRLTGQQTELTKSMRTHKLTTVIPPIGVPGCPRKASMDDAGIVSEWCRAFAAETQTLPESAPRVAEHIKNDSISLWTDPEPVAMAVASANTPNGGRVGGVYTPPHLRGRGYASALVAQLSQSILDSGKRFCFLFTDLANPTSNSIYRKIGYEPVSDFAEYRFADG